MAETIPSEINLSMIPQISWGIYQPENILTNEEIETWNLVTFTGAPLTAESISRKTGVERRYVASRSEDQIFMALEAAQRALGFRSDVDAVFVSNSYPMGVNIAQKIILEMGLPAKRYAEFGAACSGYARILHHIRQAGDEMAGEKVLIVCSEKYSPTVVPLQSQGTQADPSMAQTIFSDGAVAMVGTYKRDFDILASKGSSLPEDYRQFIQMPIDRSGIVEPYIEEPVPLSDTGYFRQDGVAVFKSVLEYVPNLIRETIAMANLTDYQEVKQIFPHQASAKMLKFLGFKLDNLSLYQDLKGGNWSSASIPKAMMRAVSQSQLKSGDTIVVAGFGAGMYAATAAVKLN